MQLQLQLQLHGTHFQSRPQLASQISLSFPHHPDLPFHGRRRLHPHRSRHLREHRRARSVQASATLSKLLPSRSRGTARHVSCVSDAGCFFFFFFSVQPPTGACRGIGWSGGKAAGGSVGRGGWSGSSSSPSPSHGASRLPCPPPRRGYCQRGGAAGRCSARDRPSTLGVALWHSTPSPPSLRPPRRRPCSPPSCMDNQIT